MNIWTAFEQRLQLTRTSVNVENRIEIAPAYAVELDAEAREIVSVKLHTVAIDRRAWDGQRLDTIKLGVAEIEQLRELFDMLDEQRETYELLPPPPTPIEDVEQGDASTGQTFTVDDGQVVSAD